MAGFEHFDFLAPFYERFIQSNLSAELRAHLDLTPGSVVLDAGGGTGRIAGLLRSAGVHVVVADASIAMLRQAGRKTGLRPVGAHTEKLPFAEHTFDRVMMVDALHHVIDQRGSVQEMLRVLKPGGKLVIEEPDIETRAVKWIALAEKIAGMRSHFLSGSAIQALVGQPKGAVLLEQKEHTVWVTYRKNGVFVS